MEGPLSLFNMFIPPTKDESHTLLKSKKQKFSSNCLPKMQANKKSPSFTLTSKSPLPWIECYNKKYLSTIASILNYEEPFRATSKQTPIRIP